ncbi:hypothetical protein [Streptomyces sp. NPDC060001]|uniref:hypothetical protein n=1 Tax=Streptomyces sp. NPDC060001 TaxID=3347032 RepID=UPI003675AE9D
MPYVAMTRTTISTSSEHGFRVQVTPGTPAEHVLRVKELLELQRQARSLWALILGGEDNPRIRARVGRLEAAQSALLGAPEMLAACGTCGRSPEEAPAAC